MILVNQIFFLNLILWTIIQLVTHVGRTKESSVLTNSYLLICAEVGGRMGIGICYDICFQELAILYVGSGLFGLKVCS